MKSNPGAVELDAQLDGRHEAAERLAVPAGRRHRPSIAALNRMVELAGNSERDRKIEMADPQAVDAIDGSDGIGVLDALRRLDLANEGGALVGGGRTSRPRAGPVVVMRDLQGNAARPRPDDTSCRR